MRDDEINRILVEKGKNIYFSKKAFHHFTGNHEADELLNNLKDTPHAYVIACVMDRQMPYKRAWMIPFHFKEKLGTFKFSRLIELTLTAIEDLMSKPEPLHRFPSEMSKNFYESLKMIKTQYDGNAANIWKNKPSSAEVVFRFLQFRGVGPKIATMAANILAREFKIPFSDYYSIDISVDVHVKRVFKRLGLVNKNASNDEVIYKARAIYPDFPGILDLPTWEIGREWCKPNTPQCNECYLSEFCLKKY